MDKDRQFPPMTEEEADKLSPNELWRKIQEAETEEERRFFIHISDKRLQAAQKIAIEKNLF